MVEDEAPLSADEAQRLIEQQRAEANRKLNPDPRLLYWPWGVSWLVGFALLFVRHGPDGRVLVNMPSWLPLTALYALMVAALLISGVSGARHARHIRGASQAKGMLYGFAWFLGFAGIAVTAGRVTDELPSDLIGLLWAALSVGFVGPMYLAGAAIWGARDLAILGAWIGAVNIVGVILGPGWHSLVVSLAGGGGMLIAGAVAYARVKTDE